MAAASYPFWVLEQEARALLTRLARVRPFALQEPMVPAAAASTEAQAAIESYLADGRRELKTVVGDVQLEIQGRSSVFTAVVEPGRTDALIGAIVLEELDFVPDCTAQALVPRDPQGLFAELD